MTAFARNPLTVLAAPVLLAVTLAGCSSSSNDVSTPGTASVIGGTTECNDATITEAATAAAGADGQKFVSLDDLQCADGWAAAGVTVGPTDGSTDGEVTVTMVFEAEGQFWIPKDRGDVCGTIDSSSASPAYPADAEVPKSIWAPACLTN